jgi:diguanylate cyclase (GGDEF)-like protein
MSASLAIAALAALPDGIALVDAGRLVLANPAFETLTGAGCGDPLAAADEVGRAAARLIAGGGGETDLDLAGGRDRSTPAGALALSVTAGGLPDGGEGGVILARDVGAQRREAQELTRMAARDPLTGLLNRRAFMGQLDRQVERARRTGRPLSLILFDLDHFKRVNDSFGHPVGDRVLVETAARLTAVARPADAVGRIGGEEFAWLVPEATAAQALAAAARGRAAVGGTSYQAAGRITAGAGPGGHALRVAELSVALAATLDWSPDRQARLHRAARLHDVGKAALPDALLRAPRTLTRVESDLVRQHPAIGASLASAVLDVEQVRWIRHDHERWDARGYPDGLRAGEVPDGAQLIGLADAFDAMRHPRPHADALSCDAALAEVDRCAGAQLRPDAGRLLRAALAWMEGA